MNDTLEMTDYLYSNYDEAKLPYYMMATRLTRRVITLLALLDQKTSHKKEGTLRSVYKSNLFELINF